MIKQIQAWIWLILLLTFVIWTQWYWFIAVGTAMAIVGWLAREKIKAITSGPPTEEK